MPLNMDMEPSFFRRHINHLPHHYASLCSNRMTLLYFTIASLDMLDAPPNEKTSHACVEWVLHQQILHEEKDRLGGFRGGSWLGVPWESIGTSANVYDEGHIGMTYTALSVLHILGYDLSILDTSSIVSSLKYLQQTDGSFVPSYGSKETDSRFVFCSCAVSALVNDWSGVNKELATEFIMRCLSYDGAFGLSPGQEGHGGSTFVCVAALSLMGQLGVLSARQRQRILHWCLNRQGQGYTGRINKDPDSCYSFWVGATIEILGGTRFTHAEGNRAFNMQCKPFVGGFGKHPGQDPDLLHSMYGTFGLSIMGLDRDVLLPCDVRLGIPKRGSIFNSE